ncbi:MAG: hydrogenase/urease accessory protein HupE, partial [Moritella dasanensis]
NNQSNPKNSKTLTKILNSDEASFTVPKNKNIATMGVFVSYVTLGFEHILAGLDHLLFVFALILLVVSRTKLIWTITCFTLAHSITLAAVTLDWLYFPGPPVEAVIALSIIFLAKEIIIVQRGRPSTTAQYPWLVAFIFGLLHGMGFASASALSDIGVPENEVFMALFSFNVGVELGQLTFVVVVLTLMSRCQNWLTKLPNWTAQIPAYVIGCSASFWLLQRLLMF